MRELRRVALLAKSKCAGSFRRTPNNVKATPSPAPFNNIDICGSGSVVERCLAKANVAGPNPVSRSKYV